MSDPSTKPSGPGTGFDRDYTVEVLAAILLGLATMLGAYAAYQSSVWSGNCLTAYNQGTNKLSDANRELLRGLQEQSFDTAVWMENIKAQDAEARRIAAEEAAEGDVEEEDAEEEEEEAEEGGEDDAHVDAIVEAMIATEENVGLAKKLAKLQSTRRDLNTAIKWADTEHAKRLNGLTEDKMMAMIKKIMALEEKQDVLLEKQTAMAVALGLDEDADEEEIFEALPDEAAENKYEALDAEWYKLQAIIEAEYDKLSRPMFFESPDYQRKRERAYKQLQEEGVKLIADGQKFNGNGDHFTLTTVLFTITLFFAGLAATLRRFYIKIVFLTISAGTFVYALVHMFAVPLA